jgi:hypothetical protein
VPALSGAFAGDHVRGIRARPASKGIFEIVVARLVPAALVLTLAGCAHQPKPVLEDAPGFLMGLWHGWIAPWSLIASLFTDVRVYAFPNTGFWYDAGFLLGVSFWVLVWAGIVAER